MTAPEIALAFVDRVGAHDLDGLCELIEDGHVFIDGLGRSVAGKERVRKAWRAYFAMVPDYWIKIDEAFASGNVVALFGRAGGTIEEEGRLEPTNRWEVPAAWRAVVGSGGLREWRVFADLDPPRRIMEKTRGVGSDLTGTEVDAL